MRGSMRREPRSFCATSTRRPSTGGCSSTKTSTAGSASASERTVLAACSPRCSPGNLAKRGNASGAGRVSATRRPAARERACSPAPARMRSGPRSAKARKAAGIPLWSPHDLRHRRISLLHLRGMPWARIVEFVGQRKLSGDRRDVHARSQRRDRARLRKDAAMRKKHRIPPAPSAPAAVRRRVRGADSLA